MAGLSVSALPFVLDTRLAGPASGVVEAGRAADAAARLIADAGGRAGFLEVPGDVAAADRVIAAAAAVPRHFRKVLVLGIGGSGLGAQAALAALAPIPAAPGAREVRVLANVDPASVAAALAWFDPADTLLDVVTKSGNTVETLSQFALFADRIRAARGDEGLRDGVVMTTDPEKGPVRRIADKIGCVALDVPPRVGGRFSVLTPVGLFPLALAGCDVRAMLAPAEAVLAALRAAPGAGHPSVLSAAIHEALLAGGAGIRVLWAYCDRLAALGDWFSQLWAESLGKAGAGQTPVRAIGSTDQHSLLQLFMEGPADKCFTFVTVDGPAPELPLPDLSALDPDLAEFAGLPLGRVFDALRMGTMTALAKSGRPVMRIRVPRLDEAAVGALFAHFEVETAVAGYLRGIDPFDQPGVEAGKRYAHGVLGKPGMEGYRDEAFAVLGEGE
ncbi:MAG: glucose-6-phosphate isomerase [Deltaproteobacteria bacterium]|nr:glucose-6-phosphate isomerase [Deltaproteobacteria bacterium]